MCRKKLRFRWSPKGPASRFVSIFEKRTSRRSAFVRVLGMNERCDAVVVGGGIGGLLCAARLARSGSEVRVIERASRAGGRALSPSVDGVPMNLGAHALYLGG